MKVLRILGGVVLVLALVFLGLGLVSTMTIENEVLIDQPVARTWQVFTDEAKASEWMINLEKIENLEGAPLEVGSKWRLSFDENGKSVSVVEKVTQCVEHEVYAFDMEADPFLGNTEVRFEPVGDRTKVTATTIMEGRNILWRSMLRVMKGQITKRNQATYENLKRVVESG